MQTTVNKLNDVEFELEITATADDLAEDLAKAIRTQRSGMTMKGFRPGNVPTSLVKKVHGKALAYGVAEQAVQKTYEEQVLKETEYDVLGQPTITDLEYEYEGDLRAVVRFGVRPQFEIQDMSSETVYRLKHDVGESDVDEEIDQMRSGRAEVVPVEGPVTDESLVDVNMQRLDSDSLTPLIGDKQDGISILMSDENVLPQLKDGLRDKKSGDEFNVVFPGPEDQPEPRTYHVTVVAVKKRELPEFNDALVKDITQERLSSVDEFRTEVRRQIEDGWTRRSKELLESDLIQKAVEKHDFPIPDSVVEMYLDAYVSELKQKQEGNLPPDFDEAQYREIRKEEARHQAKWMFLRDKIVADESLEVTDEERDAYFEKMAGEGMDVDTLKQYYQAVPNMAEQLDQRLMSDRVFDWLSERMTIEEKDLEAYRELSKSEQHDHSHDHGEHDHSHEHEHDHSHDDGDHDHDHGEHDHGDHDHDDHKHPEHDH